MKKWLSVILSIVMLSTVLGSGASFCLCGNGGYQRQLRR